MTVAIDAKQLARRYGRRWALAEVSFHVEPGTVVMVAGRNGAGKSTLLRVLATAIRPDRGTVTVGGFDVVRDREDVRKLTALLAHQNYLYESLTSSLASTVKDIEVIVVDDGSTDRSIDIARGVQEFDDRVFVMANASNRGLAVSQNRGVAIARAPWVMKVDADDYIAPTYVEEILKAARVK